MGKGEKGLTGRIDGVLLRSQKQKGGTRIDVVHFRVTSSAGDVHRAYDQLKGLEDQRVAITVTPEQQSIDG